MKDSKGELIPHSEDEKWRAALIGWLSALTFNSRVSYLRAYTDFMNFADCPPDEVTPAMITEWVKHLKTIGSRPSTIQQRRRVLSSFYEYALTGGIVDYNPATMRAVRKMGGMMPPAEGGGPATFSDMLELAAGAAA